VPRLSGKLSPQAKKSLLGPPDARVRALVELSGGEPEALERALAAAGASELHWVAPGKVAGVTLAAGRLQALAELESVAYVELAERYAP
jgi:hypothetical protein